MEKMAALLNEKLNNLGALTGEDLNKAVNAVALFLS
jgi:hypothetical protein